MRKPADSQANQGVFQLDATFGQMAVNMGSAVWNIETLSQRMKSLLCLTADVCDRNTGVAFEMHVEMALANEVSLREIREAIFHAAPEAGYSNALLALIRLKQIANEKHADDLDWQQNHESGAGSATSEGALAQRLDGLAPGFGQVWSVAVGQQWERSILGKAERALLSIGASVINQTLGDSFAYYIHLARSSGVGEAQLQDTIRFLAEFGASKAWQALVVLKNMSSARI